MLFEYYLALRVALESNRLSIYLISTVDTSCLLISLLCACVTASHSRHMMCI